MNEKNYCAGLEINDIHLTLEEPWIDVYKTQISLQQRLGLPVTPFDVRERSRKVTYWVFCILAESVELEEWLNDSMEPTAMAEAQMEAIDILHFAMNIGIDLDFPVSSLDEAVSGMSSLLNRHGAELGSKRVLNKCVELSDYIPWKDWKAYSRNPHIDKDCYKIYIELLQEVLCLCLSLNMSLADTANVYFAKNKENHARQDRSY